MAKEKANPQSPEEMVKAAQEAAVKAAMEQAQSMFGNIPGFQMPGGMQEHIMAEIGADIPNMAEIQAQQEAMLRAAGVDPATVAQAGMQNLAYAQQMMRETMDGTLGKKLSSSDTMAQMMEAFGDDEWTINRTEDCKLTPEQLRLLAFGAPMLVYNDEQVDAIESDEDVETIKYTLEERCDEDSKMGDVYLIMESMLENEWCPEDRMPESVIAWDLVRLVNLGRWAYLCGYVNEEEMWQIMQIAADTAVQHFSSWEEYGRSFIMGRGVWHGDPDDSETAYDIVSLLLENEESPWKQQHWSK